MGMLALWNTSAEGYCRGADVFFFKCNLHPSKVITCHKRNDSWRKRWRSSSSELRKWNDEDTWKEWELNSNRVKKDILSMRWEKKTGNKMSTYSKLTKQKIQHLLLRLEGTSKEFDHPSWIWLPILVSLVQHTSVYFFLLLSFTLHTYIIQRKWWRWCWYNVLAQLSVNAKQVRKEVVAFILISVPHFISPKNYDISALYYLYYFFQFGQPLCIFFY